MRAVAYRLRVTLRTTWASTVLSSVMVAVVVGVVLALAAGAQRTATAPDRYTERYGSGADVTTTQQGGPPLTAQVRHLPSVARADSITFMFAGLSASDTRQERADGSLDAACLAGSLPAIGGHIVAGRAPIPTSPASSPARVRSWTRRRPGSAIDSRWRP